VSRIEGSEWRCRHPSRSSDTGECDVVVLQQDMEAHLGTDHRMKSPTIEQVWAMFVLVRGAPSRGRPPGLGKTEDQTMTLFDRSDFR
jgi:hypothetical protein